MNRCAGVDNRALTAQRHSEAVILNRLLLVATQHARNPGLDLTGRHRIHTNLEGVRFNRCAADPCPAA
ncbi:MAG: hypothetical protein ACI9BK_001922 [Acidimicrobiales bacterium]|jgi:hypothetical protein